MAVRVRFSYKKYGFISVSLDGFLSFFFPFFPRDGLKGESEKAKNAWPKKEQQEKQKIGKKIGKKPERKEITSLMVGVSEIAAAARSQPLFAFGFGWSAYARYPANAIA